MAASVLGAFVVATVIAQELGRADAPGSGGGQEATVASVASDLDGVTDATPTESAQGTIVAEEAATSDRCTVRIHYFHSAHRCATCRKNKREARRMVEERFASELASGRLVWTSINMDEEPSYVLRYGLRMPSLVLVRGLPSGEEEWNVLDDTWTLVGSPRGVLVYGLLYTLGRAAVYVAVAALIVSSVLAAPGVSLTLQTWMRKPLGPLLVLVGMVMLDLPRLPVGRRARGAAVAQAAARLLRRLTGLMSVGAVPTRPWPTSTACCRRDRSMRRKRGSDLPCRSSSSASRFPTPAARCHAFDLPTR